MVLMVGVGGCKLLVQCSNYVTQVTIVAQHLIQLLLFLLSKQEYSWEDHGFPLVSRFFNEAASVLDEKFNVAFSFTYRK